MSKMCCRGYVPPGIHLLLVIFLVSCGGEQGSPEEQIRKLNSDAQNAVEAKDLSVLKGFIADDYQDQHGFDKRSLVRLVQLYLLGHKVVYVYTLTRSLQIIDDNNAVAEIIAAIAGQRVKNADQLFDMRADLVRFDVSYLRQGAEWKVGNVLWQRASVEDFLQ